MRKISYMVSMFGLLSILGCNKDDQFVKKGQLQFSMVSKERNEREQSKAQDDTDPFSVLVVVEDANGNIVIPQKKLPLYDFGGGYMSENLQINVGEYNLTQFLVLDENDNILYATPKKGSELAQFVDYPLPISFSVTDEESTLVTPQVLAVSLTDDPESFGYLGFGFEIIVEPQAKLREIIQDEGYGSYYKSLYIYSGDTLKRVEAQYCYNGCNANSFATYSYAEDGSLKEVISYKNNPINGEQPIRHIFEYQNKLLKKRWSLGDYNSNDTEIEFFYNSFGQPTHAIQRTLSTGGVYRDSRYWEYKLNQEGEVASVLIYSVLITGEKNALMFRLDYTHGKQQNPIYGQMGQFTPLEEYVITSTTLTTYYNINGVSTEHSKCSSSSVFESNNLNKPTKEIVSNPEGCILGQMDGTVFTYKYE